MFLGRKDLWIYVLVDDIEQINLCNLSEFDEWKKWNGKIYIYIWQAGFCYVQGNIMELLIYAH